MSSKADQVAKLTSSQIDLLQIQIRQLKVLGKRFSDSNIPRFIEIIHTNHRNRSLTSNAQGSNDNKQPQMVTVVDAVASQSIQDNTNVHHSNTSNGGNTAMESKGSDQTQSSSFTHSKPVVGVTMVPAQQVLSNASTVTATAPAPAPVPSLSLTQPALSWLCFNSLLFSGPSNQTSSDFSHSISYSTSDFGCFMKSAHVPLLPTRPFIAELSEKTLLLSSKLNNNDTNEVRPGSDQAMTADDTVDSYSHEHNSASAQSHPPLWMIQRQMRSAVVRQHISDILSTTPQSNASIIHTATAVSKDKLQPLHPPTFLGAGNYVAELIPYRNFYHSKKQDRNFVRNFEKQDRRRRQDIEEKRRRRVIDFHKVLLAHKDEFFRFHKGKRSESVRHARLAMMHVERADSMKGKDEARAEMRRIQALQENDMEAYANLIKDTKNGRLKFLLNETDTYISEINRMIQEQRVVPPDSELSAKDIDSDVMIGNQDDLLGNSQSKLAAADHSSTMALSPTQNHFDTSDDHFDASIPDGSQRTNETTKDYYRSTHRTVEQVTQPTMLRGGDLKEYQLSGLHWLVSLYNNKLNGILADEMGLGKTIQTIALICYLMEFKANKGPFLIVVPLSTLSNWVNEFNKWAPDAIKVVYKGSPDERKKLFREEVEPGRLNVLLTTYEYIMKDKAALRKPCWQYIIVDEGHRMKNAESKFAQILGTAYQSKNRILLTGTPLQNDLAELWALLNFLLPKIFHSSDTFDQWFNKPFAQFRNQTANPADEMSDNPILTQEERLLIVNRLHEVLRPFVLRRVKSEVLTQLPEKVEKILRCNLSGWQRKMYQSIVHKGLVRNKDGSIAGGLSNAIMHLRKVCNHPYLFMRDYMVDEDLVRISGKFVLLDRMLPKLLAGNHRVLMFSQMVGALNFLEQFIQYRGFTCCRLDGNTSAEDREKRVAEFNSPDSPYFIFLLSTRAGGLGINLATADTVIIFDSDWNPSMDAQAQDRAHRIGQKKEVRVFRLVTNSPIEERVLARATDKKNLNGLVVEAGGFNARTSSNNDQDHKEMMEALLNDWANGASFGAGGTEGVHDDESNAVVEDQEAEDDQINEMMAGSEEELKLYQSMDKAYDSQRLRNWQTYHNSVNKRTPPPLPPLLMEAQELPPWMTEDCWHPKYSVLMRDMMCTTTIASGSRQGMVAAAPKKKGNRKANGLTSDDDSIYDEQQLHLIDETASDIYVVAGKAMRKRKDVKYDDGMTDRQYTKYVERISTETEHKVVATAPATIQKNSNKDKTSGTIYQELLGVLSQLQQIRKDDGSFLASLFVDKPPRQYYPDYYVLIPHPISLKNISNKLKKLEYGFFEQIALDFALMSHNARVYNLDTSTVFRDCETIRSEFHRRSSQLLLKHSLIDRNSPEAVEASKLPIPLPPSSHDIFGPSNNVFRMRLITSAAAAAALPETMQDDPSGGSSKKAKYSRHKEGRTSVGVVGVEEGELLDYSGLPAEQRSYEAAGDRNDNDLPLSFKLSLKKRKSME